MVTMMAVHCSDIARADQWWPRQVQLFALGSTAPDGRCGDASCAGVLRATVYRGLPSELRGELALAIQVQKDADPLTGCRAMTGRGDLKEGQFAVRFDGKLCEPDIALRFSVSGNIQIFNNTSVCAAQDEKAAVGTLQMFGAIGTPGNGLNPIPYAGPGLTSIVGVIGQVPICDP